MLISKNELIKIINSLPEMIDTEEIMYLIHLIDKIYNGIDDIENERITDHDTLKQEVLKW